MRGKDNKCSQGQWIWSDSVSHVFNVAHCVAVRNTYGINYIISASAHQCIASFTSHHAC